VTDLEIVRVAAEHLDEVVPLMGAYCEFYEVAPGGDALRRLAQALIADPEHSGIQLLARDEESAAPLGFATLFWTFSTLGAGPIGLMNDLYVTPAARGRGVGSALIEACAAQCAERGMLGVEWYTAPSNARAQSVYDRTGAVRSEWVNYYLPASCRGLRAAAKARPAAPAHPARAGRERGGGYRRGASLGPPRATLARRA